MDKAKIIETLQYAKAYLGDVSSSSIDDTASLNEAYIYINEAIDMLKEDSKEVAL